MPRNAIDRKDATNRRQVLRGAAALGFAVGGVPAAANVSSADSSAAGRGLLERRLPFLEVALEVPGIDDGMLQPAATGYPSFLPGTDGVYVPRLPAEPASLDGAGGLVATPRGLQSGSPPVTLDLPVATSASARGRSSPLAAGETSADVVVESLDSPATISFAGGTVRVATGSERSVTEPVTVRYRSEDGDVRERTADAHLDVRYRGTSRVLAHRSAILVPEAAPASRNLQEVLSSTPGSAARVDSPRGPPFEVAALEGFDAYAVTVLSEGGER